MLYLQGHEINTVALTLNESTQSSAVTYYLFDFEDKNTNLHTFFTPTQTNTGCTNRYNEFEITLTTGATNLTGGTINIFDGFSNYTIYSQSSATNLDVTLTDEVVEIGLVYVDGVKTTTKNVFTSTDTEKIIFR